ncbi:MAG: RNA polymerase factor sigma-54 [Bacteroidota bacterium]
MQKLGLNQSLSQRLSPQQIQFIKLLQIPTAELESRIEEELEANPALEEGEETFDDNEKQDDIIDDYGENGLESDLRTEKTKEIDLDSDYDNVPEISTNDNIEDVYEESYESEDPFESTDSYDDDIDVDNYLQNDDIAGYKMQGDGANPDDDDRETPLSSDSSLTDALLTQLSFLNLDEKQSIIGKQLIGSIDGDGYIRRDLESISNDLAFGQNVYAEEDEIESVLLMIQQFDPAGIGARSLQECLLLQLDRRADNYEIAGLAVRIIEECFDEFGKKHFDKIRSKLDIDDQDDLREAIAMITKLNPKPGETGGSEGKAQYVIPDFMIYNNNGKIELSLNARNAPELRISSSYADMLDSYDKSNKKDKQNKQIKETVTFVKQKLDAAKWFIDAIKQRQNTLLVTMNAIIRYQYDFFLTGDESKLRPMILKDIADHIGMDISTVSRVANSKYVQTEFGTFSLKYFFSEGISTDSGEDVSNREVKYILKDLIEKEDKTDPLSDDKLEKILNDKGYNIARRTVAKYREQLNIPVARLRREI